MMNIYNGNVVLDSLGDFSTQLSGGIVKAS
jgi:hypothetical protein